MPMINLLPWREELRQKRKKEFIMAAFAAALLGVAITFGTKVYYNALISNQESRNTQLREEINLLRAQNAEIETLKAEKESLLERARVIEELELASPEAVTLVDAIVDIVPEGTYLTTVAQTGSRIDVNGVAQSFARVSDVMRNIEASDWLRDPMLGIIDRPDIEGDFAVAATQVQIGGDQDEESQR